MITHEHLLMSTCAPSGTQALVKPPTKLCSCPCIQRLAIVADLGITYDSATTVQHLMASNASMAVLVGDLTCEANARSLLVLLLNLLRLHLPQHPSQPICLPADADNGKFGDHARNLEICLLLPFLHGLCRCLHHIPAQPCLAPAACLVMLHGTNPPQAFCGRLPLLAATWPSSTTKDLAGEAPLRCPPGVCSCAALACHLCLQASQMVACTAAIVQPSPTLRRRLTSQFGTLSAASFSPQLLSSPGRCSTETMES